MSNDILNKEGLTSLDEAKADESFANEYRNDQAIDNATDISSVDELVEFAKNKEVDTKDPSYNPLMENAAANIDAASSPDEWCESVGMSQHGESNTIDDASEITSVDQLVEQAKK